MDALTFITCGSVDDGKSTLIGRLLVDSKAVLQDHLAGVQRGGETDLALLTDGLCAEREQGITIDVAYRYFSTESRKFIIGDAPGHEQYTRNMVTAASNADAAVVLVDATKLDWANPALQLLPQTRRHSLLCRLLRVPSIVFAVNKLDAVADAAVAFQHIDDALRTYASEAGIPVQAIVPISALKGWNVVDLGHQNPGWCHYQGPTLLAILEQLPTTRQDTAAPVALPVQWVEKPASTLAAGASVPPPAEAFAPSGGPAQPTPDSHGTQQGRRIFWGRVGAGTMQPGTEVQVFPGGQKAVVTQVLDHARALKAVPAGRSAGVVLDREVDVSRGDWMVAAPAASINPYPCTQELSATIAWMDQDPLIAGRVYWALHGHRWVKAKVRRVLHRLDIHTLAEQPADQLGANDIGHVELMLQQPIPALPYAESRSMGAIILVDTASHTTSAAVLVNR